MCLCVGETRWVNQRPTVFELQGYVIVPSQRQDGVKRQGLSIVTDLKTAAHMLHWMHMDERMMSVPFKLGKQNLIIFQIYMPDSSCPQGQMDENYDLLQTKLNTQSQQNSCMILWT